MSLSTLFAGEYVPPALPKGLEAKVAASPDGRRVYVANQPSACERGKCGEIKVFVDADGAYTELETLI